MNRLLIVTLLGFSLAGTAAAQSSPGTVTIIVLPSHYVMAGGTYNDLYRLEDAVRTMRPKYIALDSCGPRETRALVAATHRFRDLPTGIRFLNISADDTCSPSVFTPANLDASGGPTGIDDRAISEYWSALLP